eukprot:SAG11_NODE_13193_length_666_cov_0.767196_1_plen_70_part_00
MPYDADCFLSNPARKKARERLHMTDEEFDDYLKEATPAKIETLFTKPKQIPKILQFPEHTLKTNSVEKA